MRADGDEATIAAAASTAGEEDSHGYEHDAFIDEDESPSPSSRPPPKEKKKAKKERDRERDRDRERERDKDRDKERDKERERERDRDRDRDRAAELRRQAQSLGGLRLSFQSFDLIGITGENVIVLAFEIAGNSELLNPAGNLFEAGLIGFGV